MSWTDDQTDKLKALWQDGMSGAQIAEIINREFAEAGYSRNAIIGRIHRLGLPTRQKASEPRKMAPVAASRPKMPKGAFVLPALANAPGNPFENAIAAATQNALARETPDREMPDPDDNVICASRIWTDRGSGCNWVVSGRGADSMACCNRVHARGWCVEHYAIGVDGRKVSAKELARGLRRYL